MIYTAITDSYDTPKNNLPVCSSSFFVDPTRDARMWKVLSHYQPDTWTLWLDGSLEIVTLPEFETLGDLTVFKAVQNDCIYQEGENILTHNLDSEKVVKKHLARYKDEGFPRHAGMVATTAIFRRHTPEVIAFNNYWWAEICMGSRRDQLSFNYVAWKLNMPISYFEGNLYDNPYFKLHPHLK